MGEPSLGLTEARPRALAKTGAEGQKPASGGRFSVVGQFEIQWG
jgi:hypothetical protein